MSTNNQNDDSTRIEVSENGSTTLVDNASSTESKAASASAPDKKDQKTLDNGKAGKQSVKTACKRVAAGAGAGLLIGGVSTVLMGMDKGETVASVEPASEPQAVVDETIKVAASPETGMSFSDAFAAARAEVGPGGTFEWQGNLYGTYTAEEWDNLSSDEKADFANRFNWNNIDASASDVVEFATTVESAGDNAAPAEDEVAEVADAGDDEDDDIEVVSVQHDDVNVDENQVNSDEVQEDEVEVVAVEADSATMESDVDVAEADVDTVEVEAVMAAPDVVITEADVDTATDDLLPEVNVFDADVVIESPGEMLASDDLPDYAAETLV